MPSDARALAAMRRRGAAACPMPSGTGRCDIAASGSWTGGCADLRFVWPAVGASAAVALCVGLAEHDVAGDSAEQQPTSLAAMIESLSDPGSDRNPLRLDGSDARCRACSTTGGRGARGAGRARVEGDDEVVAVAAVVTRDGKIGTYELLQAGAPPRASIARAQRRHGGSARCRRCAVAVCAGAGAGRPHGGGERGVAVRQDDRQGVGDARRPGRAVVGAGSVAGARSKCRIPQPAELAAPGERRSGVAETSATA